MSSRQRSHGIVTLPSIENERANCSDGILRRSTVTVTVPCWISASSRALKYESSSTVVNSLESSERAFRSISSISKPDIRATKVRLFFQLSKFFCYFLPYCEEKGCKIVHCQVSKLMQGKGMRGRSFFKKCEIICAFRKKAYLCSQTLKSLYNLNN